MQNSVDPDSTHTGNATSPKCNNNSHIFKEGKQNSGGQNGRDTQQEQMENNYLPNRNEQKSGPHISEENTTAKTVNDNAHRECKVEPHTGNMHLTFSANCLKSKSTSKDFLTNEEETSTKKSLEEAVNRRKKINEMIAAYNSLNLSFSSCNFGNLDRVDDSSYLGIRKKTSLYNSDCSCAAGYQNEIGYTKKVSEGNYSGVTNQAEERKGEAYNRGGYGNNEIARLSGSNYLNNLLRRRGELASGDNLVCRIRDLSAGHENGGENFHQNRREHCREHRSGSGRGNSHEQSKDEDELEDYKTFLTLDSNHTIFKTKPLKLPDLSFLHNSSRAYSTLDFSNSGEDDHSSNRFCRKRILCEGLEDLSFDYDGDDGDDDSVGANVGVGANDGGDVNFSHVDPRRKPTPISEQSAENGALRRKTAGMPHSSHQSCVDKSANFFQLRKEGKKNVAKKCIKSSELKRYHIEQLLNGSFNRTDAANPVSRTHCGENRERNRSHSKRHSNERSTHRNDQMELNFLKNNPLCNGSYRRQTADLGGTKISMHIRAPNGNVEKGANYLRRISNTCDICPATYNCVDGPEGMCNGGGERHARSSEKYANGPTQCGRPCDVEKGAPGGEAHRSNWHRSSLPRNGLHRGNWHRSRFPPHEPCLNNLEKFKEMLLSVATDNLNEYAKCLQSINSEKLKSYKYCIKRVNDYSISQYLSATFRASIPVKGIEESVLTNSDTFSSLRHSAYEDDESSASPHGGDTSCEELANVSIAGGGSNDSNDSSDSSSGESGSDSSDSSNGESDSGGDIHGSLKVYKKKKKIKRTNCLEHIPMGEFNSCPEKIKSERNESADVGRTDKKCMHNGMSNCYACERRQTYAIRQSRLANGTIDSLQLNCADPNLKKQNSACAQRLGGSGGCGGFGCYHCHRFHRCYRAQFSKKANEGKGKHPRGSSGGGKNKQSALLSPDADPKNHNDELLSSSISRSGRQEVFANVKSISNCNDTLMDDLMRKDSTNGVPHRGERSTLRNGSNCKVSANWGDYTGENYLQEFSLPSGGSKCVNRYITRNVGQGDTPERGERGEMTEKAAKDERTFQEDAPHPVAQFNASGYPLTQSLLNQNGGSQMGRKNHPGEINQPCYTKEASENYHLESEKLSGLHPMREEQNNESCQSYNPFEDEKFPNGASLHRMDHSNGVETDGRGTPSFYGIQRDSITSCDSPFLSKKEEGMTKGGNQILSFNVEDNPNSYDEHREDPQMDAPYSLLMNNPHGFKAPLHCADKCEGKDIEEIIKNNKTRVEHLYDSEGSQSHFGIGENIGRFTNSVEDQMGAKPNQAPSFVHKWDNSCSSQNDPSYSVNSYNEEMEDKNLIACSLDSFNEEFIAPLSVPTPAASIFSDGSVCSPQKGSVNRKMDARMDVRMDACMDVRMDACMDVRMDACMDARMDAPMDPPIGDPSQRYHQHFNCDANQMGFHQIGVVNKKWDYNSVGLSQDYFPKREDATKCGNQLTNLAEGGNYSFNSTAGELPAKFPKRKDESIERKCNPPDKHIGSEERNVCKEKRTGDKIGSQNGNPPFQRKGGTAQRTDEEVHQRNEQTYHQEGSSPGGARNDSIGGERNGWGRNKKNALRKIVNTLEIKETKINTKQGIFEITSEGKVLFTFFGRSEIKEYKKVKRHKLNVDISKPRKLLFIIEINGLDIKVKDVVLNDVLDFYNLLEEELPKAHQVRYEYAYDVIETLKKHTPKVSLTKKWFGVYNLMSNGSTPDFMATLKNNMFIEKIEIKNNQVMFALKEGNTVTLNVGDLNGVTTKLTKQLRQRGRNVSGEDAQGGCEALLKATTPADEQDVQAVLLNLQLLLKKAGVSIDIVIQNWCNTLQAYSQCLDLLTKGNAEYTLRLRKALTDITATTELHRREIYFSIFPVIVEE
ncbi:conserved Plasmodium protein, unknown function [Plasmodium vivax]|uniref:Uncharacterized protein n=1 Tax=Plasmodium vivax TaxID=5855 RepID=A0A1G4GXI5_PLAVI|nr:conserved Plasmodium protein, unknown function [Plasmodium vivax]